MPQSVDTAYSRNKTHIAFQSETKCSSMSKEYYKISKYSPISSQVFSLLYDINRPLHSHKAGLEATGSAIHLLQNMNN